MYSTHAFTNPSPNDMVQEEKKPRGPELSEKNNPPQNNEIIIYVYIILNK